MPGPRAASSIALAVLALAAAGCGADDEPTAVGTTPAGVPTTPTVPPSSTQPPGSTQPGTTTGTGSKAQQERTEAFGRYTLAINGYLRESAQYAVAIQACAKGSAAQGPECVEKASEGLDKATDSYENASGDLAEVAPEACKKGLARAADAIETLNDVLRRIGKAAEKADVNAYNAEARKIGKELQGRSSDLVAGQASCAL